VGVHHDAVRLGIVGETHTFEEDVGASSKGNVGASSGGLRGESGTFSNLELLLSVSNTIKIELSITGEDRI